MKRLYIFFILIPLAFACDDSEDSRCISGEVLGYDGCQGVSLINVDEQYDIGDSLTFQQEIYANAIQVPGELTVGRGFFRIRNFKSGDERPDEKFFCLSIYIPFDIPAYTVLSRSDSGCR